MWSSTSQLGCMTLTVVRVWKISRLFMAKAGGALPWPLLGCEKHNLIDAFEQVGV